MVGAHRNVASFVPANQSNGITSPPERVAMARQVWIDCVESLTNRRDPSPDRWLIPPALAGAAELPRAATTAIVAPIAPDSQSRRAATPPLDSSDSRDQPAVASSFRMSTDG
jgi:hypothetical protein